MALEWIAGDGGAFVDLSATGPEAAGLWLAVRPHAEEGYWRPVCRLVAGEEEREIGDGVLGLEPAQDAIVKYAIQALAALHRVDPSRLQAEEDDAWAERAVAALWGLLVAGAGRGG